MAITDTQLTGCPVDHGAGRCPASGVDLWDFDMFQRQEHHDALALLRDTDPGIHWVDEGDLGSGYWAITRQAHLKEVNRRADVFSSNHSGTQMRDPERGNKMSRFSHDHTLIDMDPPRHTRYRKLVNRGFTPRMVGLLEDYLQNRTDIILDQVVEQGRCDFVREISAELPLQAIAEMMGIPIEDRTKVFDWTNAMVGTQDPEFVKSRDDIERAAAELFGYSHQLQTERRSTPSDDIVTTLLSADIDGEALTELEFDMFFLILCVAGNETTRNSITRGMMAFFDFPDQWEKFVSRPRPPHGDGGGGDRAMGHPGHVLPPPGLVRLRDRRGQDRRGRQGALVVRGRQPRPAGLRGPVALRHRAHPQRPRRLRWRRPALLPGHQPGPHGDPPHLPGDRPADARHPPRRPSPTTCAPTSSAASSGCRWPTPRRRRYNTVPRLHRLGGHPHAGVSGTVGYGGHVERSGRLARRCQRPRPVDCGGRVERSASG